MSESSPVISEPVLVNIHKNVAINGKAGDASDRARQQDPQSQSVVESRSSAPAAQLGEDQAAAKAQAAFRGYLVIVFFSLSINWFDIVNYYLGRLQKHPSQYPILGLDGYIDISAF